VKAGTASEGEESEADMQLPRAPGSGGAKNGLFYPTCTPPALSCPAASTQAVVARVEPQAKPGAALSMLRGPWDSLPLIPGYKG
jgi:hypothetical protein